MKILMVSVFSNHFFNWVLQLKDSGHEVYWFDVNDANTYVNRIAFVDQTVKWKRKFEYPGRYWLKNNIPFLEAFIEGYNKREFINVFQKKFDEIQPDIVHSFEMQTACVPILQIMNKNPKIKWIYSPWGTDLYYYQNTPKKLKGIKLVFMRLDYMFSDCKRDFVIAKSQGFNGNYLGTFPGGGGYDFLSSNLWIKKFESRKTILIKGYQNKFGRCNNVLKALLEIKDDLRGYEIIVFAATKEVLDFMKEQGLDGIINVVVKGKIGRNEVLELMGKSVIYVGNSISDGMPNTLLEAIVMECFPIQSNPGGASAEIINNGKNGFLIEHPDNIKEIAALIKQSIQNPGLLRSGIAYNTKYIKPKLERNFVKDQVLGLYQGVK